MNIYNLVILITVPLLAVDTPDKNHAAALALSISKNTTLLQKGINGKTLLEELSRYKYTFPQTYYVAEAGTTAKETTLQMLEIDYEAEHSVLTPEKVEERARLRQQYQEACITIAQNLPYEKN